MAGAYCLQADTYWWRGHYNPLCQPTGLLHCYTPENTRRENNWKYLVLKTQKALLFILIQNASESFYEINQTTFHKNFS